MVSLISGHFWSTRYGKNPVTREYAKSLELPWNNHERRTVAELSALVGARVIGEHMHPSLIERFTPLEGELTVKRNGKTSIVREGETAVIEPRVWHDWWNATDRRRARLLPICFELMHGSTAPVSSAAREPGFTSWRCPACGGAMRIIERISAADLLLRSPPLTRCAV
jgi:quercetin dioxygenase-like cupin family protein